MKRILPVALLTLTLASCSEPSELVPTFDSLVGLRGLPPSDGCTDDDCCISRGWCVDVETLSVRNTGGRTVTISSVELAAADDDAAGVEAFSDLQISAMEVLPGEQASLRFRYVTLEGAAHKATIVITSDADVNPVLEVGIETNAYSPPVVGDAGPDDDTDAGENDDAGPSPSEDAGPADAGADAGSDDAGAVDAGEDDAG